MIHPDDNDTTAAVPPAGAQLWLVADKGKWWIRADQVIAVGVAWAHHADPGFRFELRARTSTPEGTDGDVGPTDYALAQFSSEEEARTAAAEVTRRLGTWRHGYGRLNISQTGKVVTSRPKPTNGTTAASE